MKKYELNHKAIPVGELKNLLIASLQNKISKIKSNLTEVEKPSAPQ